MDKKFKVKENRKLVIFLSIPVLIPVLINYLLLTWHFPGVQGKEEDWLGFFSNYSGGIIGGIVAFIVANHQVKTQMKEQIKNEEEIKYINQLPTLLNIIFELKEMKKSLKAAFAMRKIITEFNEHQSGKNIIVIEHAHYPLKKLNDENWLGIQLIQSVDFQKSLITLKNDYKKISDALSINIDEIKFEITRLRGTGDKDINELLLKFEMTKGDKEWAWEKLNEIDYVEVIEDKIKLANIMIDSIEEMMDRRQSIRDEN